jgi:hypothetical protein
MRIKMFDHDVAYRTVSGPRTKVTLGQNIVVNVQMIAQQDLVFKSLAAVTAIAGKFYRSTSSKTRVSVG